jgi:pre-mRNA-splicing factor ATP-dependent RNA helicase DHX15/PRP43
MIVNPMLTIFLKVVVLTSEIGSEKTTQIPQWILYDEFTSDKLVACTQPRRLAAVDAAAQVAAEMDVKLGEEVGCSVRFDDKSGDKTLLRYMTDGLLLHEVLHDAEFSKYVSVYLNVYIEQY